MAARYLRMCIFTIPTPVPRATHTPLGILHLTRTGCHPGSFLQLRMYWWGGNPSFLAQVADAPPGQQEAMLSWHGSLWVVPGMPHTVPRTTVGAGEENELPLLQAYRGLWYLLFFPQELPSLRPEWQGVRKSGMG